MKTNGTKKQIIECALSTAADVLFDPRFSDRYDRCEMRLEQYGIWAERAILKHANRRYYWAEVWDNLAHKAAMSPQDISVLYKQKLHEKQLALEMANEELPF